MVEHYTDDGEFHPGAVQALRFEIASGCPSYHAGIDPDKRADIVVEGSAEVSYLLNSLHSDDPLFARAMDRYMKSGAFRVVGNLSRLCSWFTDVHDRIVTAKPINNASD